MQIARSILLNKEPEKSKNFTKRIADAATIREKLTTPKCPKRPKVAAIMSNRPKTNKIIM